MIHCWISLPPDEHNEWRRPLFAGGCSVFRWSLWVQCCLRGLDAGVVAEDSKCLVGAVVDCCCRSRLPSRITLRISEFPP